MRRVPQWVTNLRTIGLAVLLLGIGMEVGGGPSFGRWVAVAGGLGAFVSLTARPVEDAES